MVAESKVQFGRIYKGNPSNLRKMISGSILLFARVSITFDSYSISYNIESGKCSLTDVNT